MLRITHRIALALTILIAVACSSARASSDGRPNILFVFSDDQAVGAWSPVDPLYVTPNLQRLVDEGTHFKNSYSLTPVCPAARAAVVTGLPEGSVEYTWERKPVPEALLERSVPARLRRSGYRTGFIGKNGLKLDEARFDALYDEAVPHVALPVTSPEGHRAEKIARDAIEFLEAATEEEAQPFFLSVWFRAPHVAPGTGEPYQPNPEDLAVYEGVIFPEPQNYEQDFLAEAPEFLRSPLMRQKLSYESSWRPDVYQRSMQRYAGLITTMDAAIGEILDALDELGLAEDTIVLYASDNGLMRGERTYGSKNLAYEPATRIPLVVRGPGFVAGREVERRVSTLDFAPTFMDVGGVAKPPFMDGRSLKRLAGSGGPREFLLEHRYDPSDATSIPKHRSLLSWPWKYINYVDHDYEELFNLINDPLERTNLAGEEQYAGTLERLRAATVNSAEEADRKLFKRSWEDHEGDRFEPVVGAVATDVLKSMRGTPHSAAVTVSSSPAWLGYSFPTSAKTGFSFGSALGQAGLKKLGTAGLVIFEALGVDNLEVLRVKVQLDAGEYYLVLAVNGEFAGRLSVPKFGTDWLLTRAPSGRLRLAAEGKELIPGASTTRKVLRLRLGAPKGSSEVTGTLRLDEVIVLHGDSAG